MSKYRLVNPYIEGKFPKIYSGNSALDAAEKVWSKLTKKLTNNLPKMAFTLEEVDNQKLHHFMVKERLVESGSQTGVSYEVSPLTVKMSSSEVEEFRSKLDKFLNKQGGATKEKEEKKKKKENDDDDSSSSEDYDKTADLYNRIIYQKYNHLYQPILYWWYMPTIYKQPTFYIPTFIAPLTPYIEINLSSAVWG